MMMGLIGCPKSIGS